MAPKSEGKKGAKEEPDQQAEKGNEGGPRKPKRGCSAARGRIGNAGRYSG